MSALLIVPILRQQQDHPHVQYAVEHTPWWLLSLEILALLVFICFLGWLMDKAGL